MKALSLLVLLVMTTASGSMAQQSSPADSGSVVMAVPAVAAPPVVSDTIRQMVHKVFRRGRLLSSISTVGGATILASNMSYLIQGDRSIFTVLNAIWSTGGVATGILGLDQFSRRRERTLLAAMEKGEPLPEDIRVLLPIVYR